MGILEGTTALFHISQHLDPPITRVERLHSHIGASIQEVTAKHFATVSRSVTKRLENFYRLDLEMFDYTPY